MSWSVKEMPMSEVVSLYGGVMKHFLLVQDGAKMTVKSALGDVEYGYPVYSEATGNLSVEERDVVWDGGKPTIASETNVTVLMGSIPEEWTE